MSLKIRCSEEFYPRMKFHLSLTMDFTQTCKSYSMSHTIYFHGNFVVTYTTPMFSAGRAQCFLGFLFGLLDGKYVAVGSIVLKRKQGHSDEQAAAAPGTVVDLDPKKLEGYGMKLMLKRMRSYNTEDKQTYFCADHDMTVNQNATTSLCHRGHFVTNRTLSPISLCHQHHVVTNITLSPTSPCHQYHCVIL